MSPAEKKCYFGFDMAKNVNFKLSGDEFFMISISKVMVPLQSPGFLLYAVKFAIVLMPFVKHLLLVKSTVLTSSPSCFAGQFVIAKDPEMKSFWTSITSKAETGRTIFLIQAFQQWANSSFDILPSPDLLNIKKISLIK